MPQYSVLERKQYRKLNFFELLIIIYKIKYVFNLYFKRMGFTVAWTMRGFTMFIVFTYNPLHPICHALIICYLSQTSS